MEARSCWKIADKWLQSQWTHARSSICWVWPRLTFEEQFTGKWSTNCQCAHAQSLAEVKLQRECPEEWIVELLWSNRMFVPVTKVICDMDHGSCTWVYMLFVCGIEIEYQQMITFPWVLWAFRAGEYRIWYIIHLLKHPWASYQIHKIAGCACAVNARNVFSRHRGLAIPTCIRARAWHAWRTCHDACGDRWLAVSFKVGGGENVPVIPGACATHNFTYLVRGPLLDHNHQLHHYRHQNHQHQQCHATE